jgi:ATP-dependent DNA helicase DinG
LTSQSLADLSLAAFDRVVESTAGFCLRQGQRDMAQCIANAMSDVTLGDHPNPNQSIAVIQAGTGVGKSRGATVCLPASYWHCRACFLQRQGDL